jgi:REP element-mobilizing transposase RayT
MPASAAADAVIVEAVRCEHGAVLTHSPRSCRPIGASRTVGRLVRLASSCIEAECLPKLTLKLAWCNICPNQVGHSRQLDLAFRSWGGRRRGAGRKPSPGRRAVPHRRRCTHDPHSPVHVTLRSSRDLPSLRAAGVFRAIGTALAGASSGQFRVLHFSAQADHVHLLVEADAHAALVRGLQGLAIRLARAVNRLLGRRGRVWSDRYHARQLRTPREVRHALVYVLTNWRKHPLEPGASIPARRRGGSRAGGRRSASSAVRRRSSRRRRGSYVWGGGATA